MIAEDPGLGWQSLAEFQEEIARVRGLVQKASTPGALGEAAADADVALDAIELDPLADERAQCEARWAHADLLVFIEQRRRA